MTTYNYCEWYTYIPSLKKAFLNSNYLQVQRLLMEKYDLYVKNIWTVMIFMAKFSAN